MMLETMASDCLDAGPPATSNPGFTAASPNQAFARPPADDRGHPEVGAIVDRLRLTAADCLLQLGCGSGELSGLLFPYIGGFLGVDRSIADVALAQQSWSRPLYSFTAASVAGYVATAPAPWRFTAVLSHSGLAHLTPGDALATLRAIFIRFRRVNRILIGSSGEAPAKSNDLAALAEASGWRIADPGGPLDDSRGAGRPGILLLRPPRLEPNR